VMRIRDGVLEFATGKAGSLPPPLIRREAMA
jgi:hypothetical protein